ncbi:replication-relaxation family protein [Actinoplanes sp. HUAS TT8]|uniref:replication-relaxation family protein n=1 Tax=Actinoplanes sp. HUAS TT8 TaxID=3447453 RepID=UPI003F521BEE
MARWWSPARTFAKINHGTRPDGHGVWREREAQVAFFLEHDTGTESHATGAAKLAGYRTLHQQQLRWPVLFWLPTGLIDPRQAQ